MKQKTITPWPIKANSGEADGLVATTTPEGGCLLRQGQRALVDARGIALSPEEVTALREFLEGVGKPKARRLADVADELCATPETMAAAFTEAAALSGDALDFFARVGPDLHKQVARVGPTKAKEWAAREARAYAARATVRAEIRATEAQKARRFEAVHKAPQEATDESQELALARVRQLKAAQPDPFAGDLWVEP